MENETWYEVEYSYKYSHNGKVWYTRGDKADTIEAAKNTIGLTRDFEYRIVKVTISREVVE